MILKSFFGTLADSTPFTDISLDLHWYSDTLYDEDYAVGKVGRGFGVWEAIPYWNEEEQIFETEEEARAWLVAMYRMGGQGESIRHRVRATQR